MDYKAYRIIIQQNRLTYLYSMNYYADIDIKTVKNWLHDEIELYGTEQSAEFAKSLLYFIENTEVITVEEKEL